MGYSGWIVAIIAAGTALYACIRFIYCRGRSASDLENRVKLLEDHREQDRKEFDELTLDIKEYREEQRKRDEKMLENQTDILSKLSYIFGKMSKRDKNTTSPS